VLNVSLQSRICPYQNPRPNSTQTVMEMLFSAKNIEISYDTTHRFLYCNWIGFQNKESIFNAGARMIELLHKLQIHKVLNDNTLVTGPWQESADWTNSVWFPQMVEAGLTHFAWISSGNIFANLSARRAIPTTNVIVRVFSSYPEAYTWLNNQPENS